MLFDDASSDGTQEILKQYFQKYPNNTRLYLFDSHQGILNCAKQMYKESRGRYLAWLDADDYWIYDYKLQHQIEFLDNNPEFVGCFHDAIVHSDISEKDDEQIRKQAHQQWKFYSQFNRYETHFLPNMLICRNIIPTASLVFRNIDYSWFFEHYNLSVYSFSWAFQLYIIRNSKFFYFNKTWSVYYDYNKGISKTVNRREFIKNNIRILKWLSKDNFYKQLKQILYLQIAKEYETLAYGQNEKFLKNGFLMNVYYFKSLFWSSFWYFQRLIKQLLNIK